MGKVDSTEEYMYPEYTVRIKKAYQDFSYSFVATIDTQGKVHFQKSLIYILPEYRESILHTIKAIIDGYLKAYLQITPGKTLNIPHNTAVTLNVIGTKS